jgi:hypothetical protein
MPVIGKTSSDELAFDALTLAIAMFAPLDCVWARHQKLPPKI